ncbi:hypothetical protein K0504_05205 [Neiella marina]|uniref:Uncharacterized protein n=1 Tax=Neiella holothuriorum TaxID=2870530 RepID=A0ABS7EDL3_9GAMM|nr:hypothetical protein [Neiella holothuriorum]MBW8190427.1 hypothetical protein [Neiella holothuriorum]
MLTSLFLTMSVATTAIPATPEEAHIPIRFEPVAEQHIPIRFEPVADKHIPIRFEPVTEQHIPIRF